VLLIDDDAAHREALRGLLEARGFAVLSAADGAAGLSLAGEAQPDLVLLDVAMPGASGWEIAQALRARHGPALAIIMLTGEAADSAPGGDGQPAHDAFVAKPFEFAALLDVITARLGLEWPQSVVPALPALTLPALVAANARPHLEEIARLVRIGHVRKIEAEIDALAALGPEAAALAHRMRLTLDAFDLKALAALATAGGPA
jgi:DNA-binding response OmpR family regulator